MFKEGLTQEEEVKMDTWYQLFITVPEDSDYHRYPDLMKQVQLLIERVGGPLDHLVSPGGNPMVDENRRYEVRVLPHTNLIFKTPQIKLKNVKQLLINHFGFTIDEEIKNKD